MKLNVKSVAGFEAVRLGTILHRLYIGHQEQGVGRAQEYSCSQHPQLRHLIFLQLHGIKMSRVICMRKSI